LEEGFREAEAALNDPACQAEGFFIKATLLEEYAWLLPGNGESYAEAIQTLTKLIASEGAKPMYLIAQGRCYYKWAVDFKNSVYLKDAAASLQQALAEALPESTAVEGYFWLGMVYGKMTPPDEGGLKENLNQAFKLAVKQGSFQDNFAFGLGALAATGEFNLDKYKELHLTRYLQSAVDAFAQMGQYARNAKSEKYEFWAWNRLGYIGFRYEEKQQYVEAYGVYQRALPANISDTAEPYVQLLNRRNALLSKPSTEIQNALRNVADKPTPEQLVKDAEHCLSLVTKKPRHRWILDDDVRGADMVAAFCYHQANNNAKAVEYLNEALKFPQDAEAKKLLEGYRDEWKK
jgi:tetratricopeptide (TPR) repeat protein